MSTTINIFLIVLVNLCLSTSLRAAESPSSTEELIVIPNENVYIDKECPSEENIKRYILSFKKSRDLELDALKQYLNDKDVITERKLTKLDDDMRDIEDTIENKLNKLERRIMEKLRDYLDDKFDVINGKTEKFNQNISRDLKKISDTQDNLNTDIDQLQNKMRGIESKSVDQANTLNAIQNISISSLQKLDSLMIATNESTRTINDTVSKAIHKLETLTKETSNITAEINGLKNVTQNCTAVNTLETCPSDLAEKITNEHREIIWSECEHEIVKDTHAIWYNYSKPLQSLADKSLRHVSFCAVGNHTEFIHMRVGIQASYRGDIVLSPEQEPKDIGFFFRIDLYHHDTYIGRSIAGVFKQLNHVYTGSTLNESQPTAVLLTMFNETLQLRHEYSSEPFFEHHDKRFGDIKYFGFASAFNNDHRSKFYYDC